MEILNVTRHKYLKAWRKNIGFSQEKLAELLGVAQPTIARWESGQMAIDEKTFRAIAGLYGIQPQKLLASPKDSDIVDFLEKMHKIIEKMDDETREQWISIGEKLVDKK